MQSTRPAPPVSPTRQEEIACWLALRLTPGLGHRKALELVQRFRTPVSVMQRSASELQAAGLSGSVARSLASGCAFEEAATQIEKLMAIGGEIVAYNDPHYPPLLKEIYDPPVVLFARGRTELLQTDMIGVIGSRASTPYGRSVAERLSSDLAAQGFTIVSGMARGIDTAAHNGALAVGGATIAVFGCGADQVYPVENRKLAERIRDECLILSDFPLGTPAYPQNFPIRNRIVSGMSAGVLVVEGAEYSGSLITARLALDQGREVFAVPGNITAATSFGPNLLIKQGATLVQQASDIIEGLPEEVRRRQATRRNAAAVAASNSAPQASLPLGPMAPLVQQLVEILRVDEPVSLDDLLEKMEQASSSEVIASLFELEMLGLVRQLPGKSFVKVWYG